MLLRKSTPESAGPVRHEQPKAYYIESTENVNRKIKIGFRTEFKEGIL